MIETIRYKLALLLLGTTLLSFSALGHELGQELGQENGENIEYIDVWEIVESKGGIEAEISDESLPDLKGEDEIENRQYKAKAALLPFDEAIQMVPGSVLPLHPWSGKGFALAALGRYYESIAAFNNVLEMEPSNADNTDSLHAEGLGPSPLASGGNGEVYMALSDAKDIRYTD
ncbi:MAG TPA: tetratricopeptide repeat protein [Methanotrichaceae archaeon]|nr:tetratricopeptide repeat protein [Methanotrichaceae archaeon]